MNSCLFLFFGYNNVTLHCTRCVSMLNLILTATEVV